MYSKILVPVDLEHADKLGKALSVAARTAKENDAKVIYVDVVDAVPTTSPITEGERMADRLRLFAAGQAKAHGIEIMDQIALRSDFSLNVGADIIKAAKEADCDLIIMASHVPGIKDHFLSSNAGYVASHAPISVHVVR
ncbi:MAG: universal stress protein [Pseudomonadota bacterium]